MHYIKSIWYYKVKHNEIITQINRKKPKLLTVKIHNIIILSNSKLLNYLNIEYNYFNLKFI